MSDPDIQRVLDFWYSAESLDSLQVDSRMERWFGIDKAFDEQIGSEFGELVQRASDGELSHWKETPQGRLALIILIDQFRRNIYRGRPEAFDKDDMALALCLEGEDEGCQDQLTPLQNLFFFMPLQHVESLDIQKKAFQCSRHSPTT